MDIALVYDPQQKAFDMALAGADLAVDKTFASPTLVSLMCDRLAEAYEVRQGEDRRGWWADAFAANNHKTGSRMWLLEREKQLPSVLVRCKQYCEEALQWFVEDGLVDKVTVATFSPRMGWLVAMIKMELNGQSRTFRFEFDQASQQWQLAGEVF